MASSEYKKDTNIDPDNGDSFESPPPNPILPVPSAFALREELERLIVNDLLGPAGGPEEELLESPSGRYLVGMLAPKGSSLGSDEMDEKEMAGVESAEEGPVDSAPSLRESLRPSSFGMTFCVAEDAQALQVTARWGRYKRVQSEIAINQDTGNPKLVWKRVPVEKTSAPIPLKAGPIRPWIASDEQEDVSVQGLMRKHEGFWIVTLFLVNQQKEPKKNRDAAWLFQAELSVAGPGDRPIFRKRLQLQEQGQLEACDYFERQAMNMIYRKRVEFAVGHGVAVHVDAMPENPQQAARITSRSVPAYEVPMQTPPSADDNPRLRGLVLDMKELAETARTEFASRLGLLVDAYSEWIDRQQQKIMDPAEGLLDFGDIPKEAMKNCAGTLARIKDDLQLLMSNEQAAEAFRFANRAMWQQRIRSIYAERVRRGEKPELAAIDVSKNRTWRPFQLAFILLNLPALTDVNHKDRSSGPSALAELLWFPTGGGKTEAYLGLAAYAMAMRRLQGTVAGRSGEFGVAVLMRYTLRLLTLQQFQRAAALICACEMIRREELARGSLKWGRDPFRIGLWVGGSTTPNSTEQSAEAIKHDHGHYQHGGAVAGSGSPAQLTNCPWCGAAIEAGKHIKVETFKAGRGRTVMHCGDPLGTCPFSARQAPAEGIPLLVVDEEIYRFLPTLLIATVDKFAQMPWNGRTQMLFGQVTRCCPRHGFLSPEIEDANSHPAKGNLPAVKVADHPQLRPPDLIIQDELHLISGPLGTLVGLYESAVDELASWDCDGKRVYPKVIASTATIRRARVQVNSLFRRGVEVFPPQGVDIEDNFFSLQRAPSDEYPGRRYLGVCASGMRLKAALIRVYVAALAAAQQLYLKYGAAADPWMTLVGYFNSIRELAGQRRLVDDDIRSRLKETDKRGLARRRPPVVEELTSRIGASGIPWILDRLETDFDPQKEQMRKQQKRAGKKVTLLEPLDVLLATNMISVGVDVKRLGLMVVSGQPKTTAEYIQATSRVGRNKPGLVLTVYNWARPRDLSHYERFEHYHATFYQHVEALSVTPFAPRAMDRGLTAILVALIRLAGREFNQNERAQFMDRHHAMIKGAVAGIVARAESVVGTKAIGDAVKEMLESRLDLWLYAVQQIQGFKLGYRDKKDGVTKGLLKFPGKDPWGKFTCLNSLREVEPAVGLILNDFKMDD